MVRWNRFNGSLRGRIIVIDSACMVSHRVIGGIYHGERIEHQFCHGGEMRFPNSYDGDTLKYVYERCKEDIQKDWKRGGTNHVES